LLAFRHPFFCIDRPAASPLLFFSKTAMLIRRAHRHIRNDALIWNRF
jgi:hypothetical protein